jgi:predicted nucleotidyltransferase
MQYNNELNRIIDRPELTPAQIGAVRELLLFRLDPCLVILFGSAAWDGLRPESDIDLAFLSEKAIDAYELFLLAQQVAELVGRDVDLIDLRKASTVLKAQITSKGRVIYSSGTIRQMEFGMQSLKEYALLNEERQEILDRFAEGAEPYG